MAECGVPGFSVVNWFGIVAPASTPRPIVARLTAEIVRALRLPEVRAKLTAEGADIVGNAPEAFGAFLRADLEKWRKVIAASGWKAD